MDKLQYIQECLSGAVDLTSHTYKIIEKNAGYYLYKFQKPPRKRVSSMVIAKDYTKQAKLNRAKLKRICKQLFTQEIITSYTILGDRIKIKVRS